MYIIAFKCIMYDRKYIVNSNKLLLDKDYCYFRSPISYVSADLVNLITDTHQARIHVGGGGWGAQNLRKTVIVHTKYTTKFAPRFAPCDFFNYVPSPPPQF